MLAGRELEPGTPVFGVQCSNRSTTCPSICRWCNFVFLGSSSLPSPFEQAFQTRRPAKVKQKLLNWPMLSIGLCAETLLSTLLIYTFTQGIPPCDLTACLNSSGDSTSCPSLVYIRTCFFMLNTFRSHAP